MCGAEKSDTAAGRRRAAGEVGRHDSAGSGPVARRRGTGRGRARCHRDRVAALD